MRAALQMIWDTETWIFTVDGKSSKNEELDDDNKTIDGWLQDWKWITNEYNKDMVMFLQKIVWAHPDGLAGPQTITLVMDLNCDEI